MWKIKSIGFLAGFLCAVLFVSAADAKMIPPGGRLNFVVMRNGDKIGTQSIVFHQRGDALNVDVKTRVAVKVMFITAYRYEADINEKWRGGKLVSMRAITNDDGSRHQLSVAADGSGTLKIAGDGKRRSLPDDFVPASLWNSSFLATGKLFNAIDGTRLRVRLKFRGNERIKAAGRTIVAQHYSMTGSFPSELWYDRDGVLVRQRFKGKDGSTATYILN